jgi:hypothetical protein
MLKVTDYTSTSVSNRASITEYRIPDVVNTISVCVDNGRFNMYINGVCVYIDYSLTDGCVELNKE